MVNKIVLQYRWMASIEFEIIDGQHTAKPAGPDPEHQHEQQVGQAEQIQAGCVHEKGQQGHEGQQGHRQAGQYRYCPFALEEFPGLFKDHVAG